MIDYIEIEDPKELARLNRSLSSKLTKGFRHSELRNIGYPAGNFSAEVRFSSPAGNDVFWWRGNPSSDNLMAHNMFGRGTPGAHHSLNIDLQLNFPVVEFSRKSGGAFLRHTSTNTVVLAQRGIVTLGHGRVEKSVLFAEMTVTRRDIDTSSGPREFLLIGELDSSTLVHDIQSFASELRQRVRAIKDDHPPTGRRRPSSVSRPSTKVPTKLRQYFDEFSG